MSLPVRTLTVMVLVLGLNACASTSAPLAAAPQLEAAATAEHGDQSQEDLRYMSRVERLAKKQGVRVQWVNPPSKRSEKS